MILREKLVQTSPNPCACTRIRTCLILREKLVQTSPNPCACKGEGNDGDMPRCGPRRSSARTRRELLLATKSLILLKTISMKMTSCYSMLALKFICGLEKEQTRQRRKNRW